MDARSPNSSDSKNDDSNQLLQKLFLFSEGKVTFTWAEIFAAVKKHPEVLKAREKRTDFKYTLLLNAIVHNQTIATQWFIELGKTFNKSSLNLADENLRTKNTPLILLLKKGNLALAHFMLAECGDDINVGLADATGLSAIYWAAILRAQDILVLLMDRSGSNAVSKSPSASGIKKNIWNLYKTDLSWHEFLPVFGNLHFSKSDFHLYIKDVLKNMFGIDEKFLVTVRENPTVYEQTFAELIEKFIQGLPEASREKAQSLAEIHCPSFKIFAVLRVLITPVGEILLSTKFTPELFGEAAKSRKNAIESYEASRPVISKAAAVESKEEISEPLKKTVDTQQIPSVVETTSSAVPEIPVQIEDSLEILENHWHELNALSALFMKKTNKVNPAREPDRKRITDLIASLKENHIDHAVEILLGCMVREAIAAQNPQGSELYPKSDDSTYSLLLNEVIEEYLQSKASLQQKQSWDKAYQAYDQKVREEEKQAESYVDTVTGEMVMVPDSP